MADMNAETSGTPLTGRKVFFIFAAAFGVIITVNLTLAYNAVSTFPGLEVKNSYVASQSFERDRAAQLALGWDVAAVLKGDELQLSIQRNGYPVEATIVSAVFGRATHVGQDQRPDLTFNGEAYTAPVEVSDGNWNLRLVAMSEDGTMFRQRIVVGAAE